MKKVLYTLGVVATLASCSQIQPAKIVITQADADRAKVTNATATTETLLEGQKLYDQHCMKCHKFHPTQFGEKKWAKYMPEMANLAKIDQVTSDKILLYVSTFSKK